jgi:hypothetical protein
MPYLLKTKKLHVTPQLTYHAKNMLNTIGRAFKEIFAESRCPAIFIWRGVGGNFHYSQMCPRAILDFLEKTEILDYPDGS